MKCNNCGAKVKQGQDYCTQCGSKISKDSFSEPQPNNNEEGGSTQDQIKTLSELNQQRWYKITKVLFVITLFGLVSAVIISGLNSDSSRMMDFQETKLICDNGDRYSLGKFLENTEEIDPIPIKNTLLFGGELDEFETSKLRRAACSGGKFVLDTSYKQIGKTKKEAFWYSVLYILIIIISAEIIRRIFYFIIFGKINPPKN